MASKEDKDMNNRWERRDSKKTKRMPVHGRQIGSVYQAALRKQQSKPAK